MKKLSVTIQLDMSVPEDWELVETSEGTPVLQLSNGQFLDIAIEPLFATNPEETWASTDNEDTLNDFLDMVDSEEVSYQFVTHWPAPCPLPLASPLANAFLRPKLRANQCGQAGRFLFFRNPMSVLHQKLQWRYATKKMNPAKAVPQDKVDRILEAARLAPTSSGLQPFEIFVVTNPGVREQIKPIAWNQGQITDCSHLLVFAAWDNYTTERINMMFDLVNTERGLINEGWENYRQMLLGSYPSRDAQTNFEHAARQAYIGLGAALIAAAFEEVDSTPMEGFDPKALDEILGLKAKGLRSVAILPLGYREESGDWLVNLKKVRRPRDQFITEVK